MKKNVFLMAMLGMVLAFGLVVVGCDNGSSGGGGGSGGNASTPAIDTGTTIAGCAYSDKEVGSSTHYLLSISYDEALSILTALWGDPAAGFSLQNSSTLANNARSNNGVIFEDTAGDYRLCRVIDGRWEAVGWNKVQ